MQSDTKNNSKTMTPMFTILYSSFAFIILPALLGAMVYGLALNTPYTEFARMDALLKEYKEKNDLTRDTWIACPLHVYRTFNLRKGNYSDTKCIHEIDPEFSFLKSDYQSDPKFLSLKEHWMVCPIHSYEVYNFIEKEYNVTECINEFDRCNQWENHPDCIEKFNSVITLVKIGKYWLKHNIHEKMTNYFVNAVINTMVDMLETDFFMEEIFSMERNDTSTLFQQDDHLPICPVVSI